jgi:DNA-binding NarL/FixJ family response regulator
MVTISAEGTIRVALADDHVMVREGIRALIERQRDMQVVFEVGSGTDLIDRLRQEPVDVVVCDVTMPGVNGLEAAQWIQKAKLPVKVLVLSAHSDREYMVRMFRAGAAGYIIKSSAGEELIQAIRAVYDRGTYLSSPVAGALVKEIQGAGLDLDQKPDSETLRTREREVLALLAQGQSSKDIARKLLISVRTVETHRRNISRRLKIRSVAELVKYALREGITTIEN